MKMDQQGKLTMSRHILMNHKIIQDRGCNKNDIYLL